MLRTGTTVFGKMYNDCRVYQSLNLSVFRTLTLKPSAFTKGCYSRTKYEGGEPSRVGNRAAQKCKPSNNSLNSRLTTNLKVEFRRSYTLLESLAVMAPLHMYSWSYTCTKGPKSPYPKPERNRKTVPGTQPLHEWSQPPRKICNFIRSIH